MRTLLPLLKKEARDARGHLVGAAVIALLVSSAAHQWLFRYREGPMAAHALVPLLVGLFVASLASDLVAADVATKRIEALAILPVPVARLWTGKAVFLAAAGAAFLVYVVALQSLILHVSGATDTAAAFESALSTIGPHLAVVFAL